MAEGTADVQTHVGDSMAGDCSKDEQEVVASPLNDIDFLVQAASRIILSEKGRLDFSDLPSHFLVEVAGHLPLADKIQFGRTFKRGFEAVTQWGRSQRALDIKRLVSEFWPEERDDLQFLSLLGVQKEMEKLSSLFDFSLISSIDFDGIGSMDQQQLETIFGDEPLINVKSLNLAGTVIMPEVWQTLAHLFPCVKTIRCTEEASAFPPEIVRAVNAMANVRLGPNMLTNQRRLEADGLLDEERVFTLRCIMRLFPSVRHVGIE